MVLKKKLKRRIKQDPSIEVLKKISEDFKGLGYLSDEEQFFVLPTVLPSLNRASLIGGIPGGSIIEFHGPNQGGKTVLGLALLTSAQKLGHLVGVLDYEGSFKDKKWPTAIGLNLGTCMYKSPKTFEEGADWLNEFIFSYAEKQRKNSELKNRMMLWLVDSVTAMVPKDEFTESVSKRNFGLRAQLLSRWLSKLNAIIKGTNISVILVNQERARVGAKAFQTPWQTAGGEALKYYAHFRVRVLQSAKSKIGDKIIGKEHRFIVEKNKVSAPDELGYFFTSNGKYEDISPLGLDLPRTLFKEALIQEIIVKKGKQKYTCDFLGEEGQTERKFIFLIENDRNFVEWLNHKFERRQEIVQRIR